MNEFRTAKCRRYALLPQMRDYDRLQPEGFRSNSCNTDAFGCRHTYRGEEPLTFQAFTELPSPKGVVVGGSAAFGVGASHDRATIPSLLSREGGMRWWNAGGRAFNSTQEVLWSLLHLPRVDEVILLTGVNNLLAHQCSANFIPGLGGPR